MRQVLHLSLPLAGALLLCSAASFATGPETQPSRRHFIFLDQEFILTLELVRPGVPIFNFINLGNGSYQLAASDIRIIAGIKLFHPNLFDVETSNRRDPLRVGSMRVHPHSSFGVTLRGSLETVEAIDRVSIQLGNDRFELRSISLAEFDDLSKKISQINLISPDIREDFRVLELKPLGTRKHIPK